MGQECHQAFADYDAKRQKRCRMEKACERIRKIRDSFSILLGVSVATIISIAGALTAAAASGIALPAAIATALLIIGYAAIFIAITDIVLLIRSIYEHLKCIRKAKQLKIEEDKAREHLIQTNADDQEELARYLGIPGGC